ncbi:Dbl homology domain-containing protein [Zopfochytrium polystomum]|nr:Dbl homology domain-containing protein [Zopfochytrium polystomum]
MFAFLTSPAVVGVTSEPLDTARFDSLPKEEFETVAPPIGRMVARLAIGEDPDDEMMDEPPPLSPPIMLDEAQLRRLAKRDHAAKEILSTEKHYNRVLIVIQKVFLPRLRSAVGRTGEILDKKAIDEIFSNIEDIMPVNAMLLELLRDKIESRHWNPATSCLGEIFMKLAPFLKMYSTYYANFSKALAVISDKMSKRPAFERFLKDMARLPECGGLRLDAFLLEPIQRIPRYKMLLEELMKYTDPEHPDFEKLNKAVNIVSQVASQMNEKVRLHEMFLEMLNIQRSLVGFNEVLLMPGRRLVRSGPVTKICRSSNQVRQLILFTDILIYARPISTKFGGDDSPLFYYKQKIYLDRCSVADVPDSESYSNTFQIIGHQKSFSVFVDSPAEKAKWMRAIQSVIAELEECRRSLRTSVVGESDFFQAPVWVPNQERSNCKLCSGEFTLLRRRHHCRKCGGIVCSSCSSKSFVIPAFKDKPRQVARACDTCFEAILNDGVLKPASPPLSALSLNRPESTEPFERRRDRSSVLSTTSTLSLSRASVLWNYERCSLCGDSLGLTNPKRYCPDCNRTVCLGCSSKSPKTHACDACFYNIPPSQVVVFESGGGWSSAFGGGGGGLVDHNDEDDDDAMAAD